MRSQIRVTLILSQWIFQGSANKWTTPNTKRWNKYFLVWRKAIYSRSAARNLNKKLTYSSKQTNKSRSMHWLLSRLNRSKDSLKLHFTPIQAKIALRYTNQPKYYIVWNKSKGKIVRYQSSLWIIWLMGQYSTLSRVIIAN